MSKKIIKPGTYATDTATGMRGMITLLHTAMGGAEHYIMQPPGLHEKTRKPLKAMWYPLGQLTDYELVDAPYLGEDVLGSAVKDKASGFEGIATSTTYHINGCLHVNVTSKEKTKDGEPVGEVNFDIRQLEGEKIKEMSPEELEHSRVTKPSPCGDGITSPYA